MALGTTTANAVNDAVQAAAQKYGLDPNMLHTFVRIESGGNPLAVTGSYKGLLQLGPEEFAKHGGGNIFSIPDNVNAGAAKIASESAAFQQQYGRPPSGPELYMIHQQGVGGAAAHMENPDQPAWRSMLSTGEGKQKGESWAKQAIWGNVPDDMKRKFGSVDNITSGDFTNMWADKYDRKSGADPTAGGEAAPMPVSAPQTTATAANMPSNIMNALVSPPSTPSLGGGGGGGAAASDPTSLLMGMLGLSPANQGDSSGDNMDALKQKVAQLEQQQSQAGYGKQVGDVGQGQGSIIAAPPPMHMPDLSKIRAMMARNRGRLGVGSGEV